MTCLTYFRRCKKENITSVDKGRIGENGKRKTEENGKRTGLWQA